MFETREGICELVCFSVGVIYLVFYFQQDGNRDQYVSFVSVIYLVFYFQQDGNRDQYVSFVGVIYLVFSSAR